jgi:hypothetical protein
MAGLKRQPNLPSESRGILSAATKADLLEAAWHLASLCNDAGSCDDTASTRTRLIEEINKARAARGTGPIRP